MLRSLVGSEMCIRDRGRTDKGLYLTTGTFTLDAKKEAIRDGVPPIELVAVSYTHLTLPTIYSV